MPSFDASLAAIFLGSSVSAMLLALAGMLASRATGGSEPRVEGDESSIGAMAATALALLGFMLTFTFGMTGNRFEQRQGLLMTEVNAIGTAYLRADFAPEPRATVIRQLLREYVDLRVRLIEDPGTLNDAMRRSERIHAGLWEDVARMSAENQIGEAQALLVESLNQVIDLHSERVTVNFVFRLPVPLWIGLGALASLGMLVAGYQLRRPSLRAIIMCWLLCVAFAFVITLIANLDRAAGGTVSPNQAPFLDLHRRLQSAS